MDRVNIICDMVAQKGDTFEKPTTAALYIMPCVQFTPILTFCEFHLGTFTPKIASHEGQTCTMYRMGIIIGHFSLITVEKILLLTNDIPRIYLWGMGEYEIYKYLYITRIWEFRPQNLPKSFGKYNLDLTVNYHLYHILQLVSCL